MKRRNESCEPILARSYAIAHGLWVGQVIHYCRTGEITGTRFDRDLWQWVLYPHVKLLVR